ncbi:AMP-binding enzyme [Photobacterium sanctipauli]
MIVSGGFNIYPNEVENTLYNHQAVFEACVVGAPDPDLGEVVKAVVVLKDGSNVSESKLIDHCTKELGKFKKPDSIDFVASLPKNNAGKIQRRDVRATYWKDEDRQI